VGNAQDKRYPKPEAYKPDTHFPDVWPVNGYGGKPRCPGWSRSAGAQCGRIAGYGTPRKGEVGACCKSHGGSSAGAPKGNTNAVNPDAGRSEYVRIDQLKELAAFEGMSDLDMADILVKLVMAKTIKIASVTPQDDSAAKLLAVISSANSVLRTKQIVERNQIMVAEARERQGKASEEDKNTSKRERAQSVVDEVNAMFNKKD
tara:strand:- start:16777 stop:17385 length:609 start_codon:yes stop_codon:yes gene_type:complete